MPIYLIVAYVVFLIVPLGLGLSLAWRRRRVARELARWEASDRGRPVRT